MSHTPRVYDAVIQTLGRIALLCVLGIAGQAEATDVRLSTATIRLVGNDSVQISAGINNFSAFDSATLKLELWAFAAPWDGTGFGATGIKVAEDVIGKLDAQAGVGILNDSRSYTPPPAGTWYFTMVLTEFAAGETGDSGYVLRGFLNFPVPVTVAPTAANYQGLWWAAGGAENFWGINFAHQGNRVFGTWYTYDTSGNVYWLSMLADRTTPTSNTYSGDINVDVGPPFNNFVGSGTFSKVGTGTVTFSDVNNGSFSYNLNTGTGGSPVAVTQTKSLARFDLGTGPQPTCTFSATANLAAATNYQDLWWAASGTESGWGINFAHQGNSIFATWYTYDAKGAGNNPPMWLSALLQRQGTSNVFSGPISRTSGPRFDNYKASDVVQPVPTVGSATVTFADGNSATFNYTTNGNGGLPAGVNQTKAIVRFPFGPGGTVCVSGASSGSAEGVWRGTMDDGGDARAVVLDDGSYVIWYASPLDGLDVGVTQGSSSTTDGKFSSPDGQDYPIVQVGETSGSVKVATVSGTFVARRSLQLTIAKFSSSRVLTATYDAGYEKAASPASVAGTYTGYTGHTGGSRGATFTLGSDGKLSGTNDASCDFNGTFTPHKSVDVFDWTVTGNGSCIFGLGPISGVMYYDAANRQIHGFAPYAGRDDIWYLIGTKP